jgi:hypothetical protein
MYATQFVQDTEDSCELMEKGVDFCPLCAYQNDNIIQNIAKVEASLVGKIDNKQIYTVICDMYRKHVEPLKRQGKKLMDLDEKTCEEHYTRHVVNTTQQIADDILYCSKMQRNPQCVNEYVKISKHKLELVKYFTNQRRKQTVETSSIQPYAFN